MLSVITAGILCVRCQICQIHCPAACTQSPSLHSTTNNKEMFADHLDARRRCGETTHEDQQTKPPRKLELKQATADDDMTCRGDDMLHGWGMNPLTAMKAKNARLGRVWRPIEAIMPVGRGSRQLNSVPAS